MGRMRLSDMAAVGSQTAAAAAAAAAVLEKRAVKMAVTPRCCS
jgi:hypothetical protein